MRLYKLSIFTILALTSVLQANEVTLADSLSNGKISGEFRSTTVLSSYTQAGEASINNNAKASSIGLQLNYESADFYGFNIGIGFQTAHDLDLQESDITSSGPKGEDEPRTTVSGSSLYVAYLGYTKDNTNIKIGKQRIVTPLITISNTFPLVDSFNGLSITNKDLPDTELRFYALKDWYQRYDAEGSSTGVTHFKDPLYSLYIKNKSIKDVTLEGQYMTTTNDAATNDSPISVSDGYSTYFASFDYKLPIDFPLSIGSFYSGASYDTAGEPDATFFGFKMGAPLPYLGYVKLAYTSVTDDNSFPGALGHTPNFFKYNGGQMFTDNYFAGLDAASILVIPKININGLKTMFSYASYSQSAAGITKSGHDMDGASELQADIRYSFGGAFKGLSTRLQLAYIDYDDNTVSDDKLTTSRIYLSYKF